MKKLFVLAMAAVFSLGVGQVMAQDKKAEEKKEMKSDKKDAKMEKKADKKMDKKDAANPCAAKADKK